MLKLHIIDKRLENEFCTLICTLKIKKDGKNGKNGIVFELGNYSK